MFRLFRRLRNINYKTSRTVNIQEISYSELLIKVKGGAKLIDVRTRQEFLERHLNGAIVIPYYEISKKIEKIIPNKEQEIVVYCKSGARGITATQILNELGYKNVCNLKGGIDFIMN